MTILRVKHGSEEWLAVRRRYLGASETPALFNAGYSGDTFAKLIAQKAGLDDGGKPDTSAMQDGRELEPWVAGRAARRAGVKYRAAHDRIYVDDERRLCASLDYMVLGSAEPVEVKCVRSFLFREEWGREKSAFGEGTAPLRVETQVQQQLLLTGAERAWIVAYSDMAHYGPWERKPHMVLQEEIIKRAADFWTLVDAVKIKPEFFNRVPVQAADCELLERLFPRQETKARLEFDDDELAGIAAEMLVTRQTANESKKQADDLKARALARLQGRSWVECLGFEIKVQSNGALNVKALKEAA